MNSLQDIERAIGELPPQELAELHIWLGQDDPEERGATEIVFEQGLGLFGSPEDAALLDDVVALAYVERRRSGRPIEAR